MTEEQVKKAARVAKIMKLVATPGMDVVAIKLNSQPTYDEVKIAENWSKIFDLVQTNKTVWEIAQEIGK